MALAGFAVVGIAFALWVRDIPAGRPDPRLFFNVFFVLFARNEPLGLSVFATFSLASAWFCFGRKARLLWPKLKLPVSAPFLLSLIAAATFVVAATGTDLVFHNYALTADEYLADFQSRIFLHGKIQAEVPAQWLPAEHVIRPTFVAYFPATHAWNAPYLPIYAAMRAVFLSVQLQSLLNPLLAAISVIALYGTARNLWPGQKENALAAAALLASSSQFLVMAMTSYAMPAHLALNTTWLWLYSQPDRRRFYLAPVLGVLAIGLHQPIVHALFAAPFLLRLVWQRRWRSTIIFGAIYLIGCAGWYLWKKHYEVPPAPSSPAAAGIGHMFRLFNPRMAFVQPTNLLLMIAWGSLATPLLVFLGFRRFFRLSPFLQDAALSCLLTFGFYYFFYLDQAHGWGYRYFHGTLACLILVAISGWNALSERVGAPRARNFLLLGVACSIVIQLPLRCWQAEGFTRPFARAAAALHAMRTDMVALDPREAWYSGDLIRNDPFLEERPVIVSLYQLNSKAVATLEKAGSVRFIDRKALARFGLATDPNNSYRHDPFRLDRGK